MSCDVLANALVQKMHTTSWCSRAGKEGDACHVAVVGRCGEDEYFVGSCSLYGLLNILVSFLEAEGHGDYVYLPQIRCVSDCLLHRALWSVKSSRISILHIEDETDSPWLYVTAMPQYNRRGAAFPDETHAGHIYVGTIESFQNEIDNVRPVVGPRGIGRRAVVSRDVVSVALHVFLVFHVAVLSDARIEDRDLDWLVLVVCLGRPPRT